MTRPYLSPASLECYSRCPKQYEYRYLRGEIKPPGIAAHVGGGVHHGISTNFVQKIKSYEDLPAADIVDAAVSGFDDRTKGGYVLTPDESAAGKDKTLGAARDRTASFARCHAKYQSPEYQPVLVEQGFRIKLSGTHDLLGFLDMADDQGRIADFKTGKRGKTQQDADTSLALTAYSAAHKLLRGSLPTEVVLDSMTYDSKGVAKRATPRRSTRTVLDLQTLQRRIHATLAAIQTGIFPPTSPTNWWCSQTWCGWHAECPYAVRK